MSVVLPAGTYALQIYNRLLIDLTWNSSRLEGNTYSLLETERLLAVGEVAEGKDAFETQMILNHKAAVLVIKEYAANEIDPKDQARFIEVTETELMSLHEGNIARYRIRPSQFGEWERHWR